MSHTTYEQRIALGAGIASSLLDGEDMRASTHTIYDTCLNQGVVGITTDLVDDRLREMVGYGDIAPIWGPCEGVANANDGTWYHVTQGYTKLWYTLDDARRGKAAE